MPIGGKRKTATITPIQTKRRKCEHCNQEFKNQSGDVTTM